MKKSLTDEEALGWLFPRLWEAMAALPTSMDDMIGWAPQGYGSVWELKESAERALKRLKVEVVEHPTDP